MTRTLSYFFYLILGCFMVTGSQKAIAGDLTVSAISSSASPAQAKVITTCASYDVRCRLAQAYAANQNQGIGIGLILPEKPRFLDQRDRNRMAPIQRDQYQVPFLPPFQTSNDGRVALDQDALDGPEFHLIVPEKLRGPVLQSANGAEILSDPLPFGIPGYRLDSRGRLNPVSRTFGADFYGLKSNQYTSHATVCDAGQTNRAGALHRNPDACGDGMDCYRLNAVIGVFERDPAGRQLSPGWTLPHKFWFRSIEVIVKVKDPKTSSAKIFDIAPTGKIVDGPQTLNVIVPNEANPGYFKIKRGVKENFEPMFTSDGKLLVTRFSGSPIPWERNDGKSALRLTHNISDADPIENYDTVYSTIPDDREPCDLSSLRPFKPLVYAPSDPDVRTRYGFAMKPFRDFQGKLLPDDEEFHLTYPWVDRGGRNVFFTTVGVPFHFETDQSGQSIGNTLHPARCAGGRPLTTTGVTMGSWGERCRMLNTTEQMLEEVPVSGKPNVAFMGSWSYGKMVLLDGQMSSMDFGFLAKDFSHREAKLYQEEGKFDGYVRLGSSADIGRGNRVPGSTNINLIQSYENLFNYKESMRPGLPRDVVWTMMTGRGADEVIFDDYIDPNVLIYSDMTGAMEVMDSPPGYENFIRYHNGIKYEGWYRNARRGGEIRLQNSATGFGDRLIPPSYGRVIGESRLESVALGGVRGKGFWLTGVNAIEYSIPYQRNQSDLDAGYTASIFLDSRMSGGQSGKVLTFPAGGSASLRGVNESIDIRGLGFSRQVVIPPALGGSGWKHFALSFRRESASHGVMEVLWNGYRLDSFQVPLNAGFTLGQGTIAVGTRFKRVFSKKYPIWRGFKGWIDEFKIIARNLSPEEQCNHAFGTLVAVTADSNSQLRSVASSYPSESHQAVSNLLINLGASSTEITDKYVCYLDYSSSKLIGLSDLPSGTVGLRDRILKPEGSLVWNRPRPDSSQNAFCLSCHLHGGAMSPSFGEAALKWARVSAINDRRRQPMQAPPRVWGEIPAQLFGPSAPSYPRTQSTESNGLFLDQYLHPR